MSSSSVSDATFAFFFLVVSTSSGFHSNLRIKLQNFSGPEIPILSAPIFVLFWAMTNELDSKTRHCENKSAEFALLGSNYSNANDVLA